MKKKRICLWLAALMLVSAALAEEAAPFMPDFSELREIRVGYSLFEPGWRIRFSADGGGTLTFSGADISARVPPGSFPAEEIYTLLAPHFKRAGDPKSETLFVGFIFFDRSAAPSKSPSIGFHIEDRDAMRALMHGFLEKAVLSSDIGNTELEGIFSKYPLVPGDDPMPFTYDDAAHHAAVANFAAKTKEAEKLTAAKLRRMKEWREGGEGIEARELAVKAEIARWQAHFDAQKALQPEPAEKEEPAEPAPEETPVAGVAEAAEAAPPENVEATASSPRRPWLPSAAILCAICAGVAFWLFRKKK